MIIHARPIACSIARSAALSFALFALAACGGGGGDSSSSSAPPAPSTAARQVALTDAENTQHCQGRGGIKVLTGIDDNRDGDLDVPDEVDATEYVCNGVAGPQGDVGPQGNPGVDGTATVIIYFELGQTFTLPEDAAAGDSAGTITAFTSNGTAVAFAEADSSSDAFDVSDAGEITLAADVSLDFETQNEYVIAVVATATDAPDANFSVRISIIPIPVLQDGTAANPWRVGTLGQLQSIATGFSNPHIAINCVDVTGCDSGKLSTAASLAAHYRQTADIDASPTASGTWLLNDKGNSDASDDEHGFQPIGGTFGGSYDGGGYLITSLFINRNTTDNVGLFAATGGGSVVENVALVGADVTGKNQTGVLVGDASGTVRGSFASGRLKGIDRSGGLVGRSNSAVEDCLAAVAMAGEDEVGGLAGAFLGSVRRSFALGSVSTSGIRAGGMVGALTNMVSHSFATGIVSGNTTSGGLVGLSTGSVRDSYATGSATGSISGGLLGNGDASRSYRVTAGGSGTEITLDGLRVLACDQDNDGFVADTNDAIFEDADGNTCATAGAAAFPWDFGTDADLPVINGLVGGLDAEGQRLAVEFSLVDRAAVTGTITSPATSVDVTLTAPTVGREAGSVLSYFWVLERSEAISADDLRAREVIITAEAGSYAAHLTIIERDAAGTLLAVYADEFTLTVN